jgi:hypothetical protein
VLAGLIHHHRVSESIDIPRLVSPDGLEKTNEGPHDPTRCHFMLPSAIMQHMTLGCTGIGLREVYESSTAIIL